MQKGKKMTDDPLSRSLNVCPRCGGVADNGHDRCLPPSPYFCTKCTAELEKANSGQSEISLDEEDLQSSWEAWSLNHPFPCNDKDDFTAGYKAGRRSTLVQPVEPSWGRPCYGFPCGCDGCKAYAASKRESSGLISNTLHQAKDAVRFLEMGQPSEALQICREIINRIESSK